MHIALLAGEPSGDQLGAELIKSLRRLNPSIRFDGVGGPLMQAQGFNSLLPIDDFAVMGISEIIRRLPRLLRYRRQLFENYQNALPDAFIGIDYPEFNLSLEKKLKQIGIYTVHYVSPSVWAWRENRIHHIKASCDLMLTLFDFEKTFYDKHQMPAVHCGHPLVDIIPEHPNTVAAKKKLGLTDTARYLAMLPGSRLSEIQSMLPIFVDTANELYQLIPDICCLIPAANKTLGRAIKVLLQKTTVKFNYKIILQQSKTVMLASDAVLLASGTAALEAMLLQKPMLVAYKVSTMTAFWARRLVNVTHFSLPNLLADHPIVPEYIQNNIDTTDMAKTLYELIVPSRRRNYMIEQLIETRKKLRKDGANTAAKAIYEDMLYKELLLL